jgi:hypothetical protein
MSQLTLTVPVPGTEIAAYGTGALLRWESGASSSGPFTERGTTVLDPIVTFYAFDDPSVSAWYRTRFSDAGGTSFSAYAAVDSVGGYCSLLDVKQRQTGDVPVQSSAFDATILDAIAEVSDLINGEVRNLRGEPEGWSFLPGTPTVSRYTGRDAPLLMIHDSVAVSATTILDPFGNVVQVLSSGLDYLPWPMNGLPITGLTRVNGWWPSWYGGVQVSRTPGYGLSVPPNVRGAALAEVIRAIRAGQAGEDDRLGMTPFGSVVVSKALLQSTLRMLSRYRNGAALLRGPG